MEHLSMDKFKNVYSSHNQSEEAISLKEKMCQSFQWFKRTNKRMKKNVDGICKRQVMFVSFEKLLKLFVLS